MQRPGRLAQDPIELAAQNWRTAGWAEAVDGMSLVTSIMRVQQIVLGEVERILRPFDLTFSRYEVLMLLHFSRRGALAVGKIGERLQVHPASVTNAVDRLERDHLVCRIPNPADRRSVMAELTEAGRTRALAATDALNTEVFTALPLEGAGPAQLFGLLRQLRHAAGDFD
jgi:DNA-binding MarR family transcriptional regulator